MAVVQWRQQTSYSATAHPNHTTVIDVVDVAHSTSMSEGAVAWHLCLLYSSAISICVKYSLICGNYYYYYSDSSLSLSLIVIESGILMVLSLLPLNLSQ